MRNKHPDSYIKFSLMYQHRFFYILLEYKLMSPESHWTIWKLSDIVITIELFRLVELFSILCLLHLLVKLLFIVFHRNSFNVDLLFIIKDLVIVIFSVMKCCTRIGIILIFIFIIIFRGH